MTARRIAARSAAALRAGVSPAAVELPLLVHLPDLVVNSGAGDKAALRTALGTALGAEVAGQAHERRSWLLLDALDVCPTPPPRRWRDCSGWCRAGRVGWVVTSRPAGRMALPFGSYLQARTAPLTAAQVEAFLQRRGGKGAERVCDALAAGGPLAELVQNPFLLTVACWGRRPRQTARGPHP